MDYLVELARHPDILEAIHLKSLDSSKPAVSLREVDFLATEHPNAWVVEVVHQFYANPEFASEVWANLRYCAASRRRLAELEAEKQSPAWIRRQQPTEERVDKSCMEAAKLLAAPARVDALCAKHGEYPKRPATGREGRRHQVQTPPNATRPALRSIAISLASLFREVAFEARRSISECFRLCRRSAC